MSSGCMAWAINQSKAETVVFNSCTINVTSNMVINK
jgi:hypothetical protein